MWKCYDVKVPSAHIVYHLIPNDLLPSSNAAALGSRKGSKSPLWLFSLDSCSHHYSCKVVSLTWKCYLAFDGFMLIFFLIWFSMPDFCKYCLCHHFLIRLRRSLQSISYSSNNRYQQTYPNHIRPMANLEQSFHFLDSHRKIRLSSHRLRWTCFRVRLISWAFQFFDCAHRHLRQCCNLWDLNLFILPYLV